MVCVYATNWPPNNTAINCCRSLIVGILAFILCMSIQTPLKAEQNDAGVAAEWIDPDQINSAERNAIQDGSNSPPKMQQQLSWEFVHQVSTDYLPSKEAIVLLLNSVEQLLSAGHFAIAVRLIHQFDNVALNVSQLSLLRLLEAKAFYMNGKSQQSLKSLNKIDESTLSGRHKLIAAWLRTANLISLGRVVSALQESKVTTVNSDNVLSRKTAKLIFNDLLSRSAQEIEEYMDATTDPYSIAWFTLALALEQATARNSLQELKTWMQQNSSHGAYNYVSEHIVATQRLHEGIAQQIALLMPISSDFQDAAIAIMDGFSLASSQGMGVNMPKFRIYDYGNQTELIEAYYEAALRDGADFVIGPLGKSAVESLARREKFPVPTLVLGHLESVNDQNDNIFQFSLSPEDDAEAVADRAYSDGARHAVALYPDTKQGHRIFSAWSAQWKILGGRVTQSYAYDIAVSDHSQSIKALFNIDLSSTRLNELRDALPNTPSVKFSARRRQDIDVVFLLGNTQQTRLIKPQIEFHHAHDLPVYSLKSNYIGIPDLVADLDLEGVIFGDIPWILNHGLVSQSLRKQVPKKKSRYGTVLDRFYALGMDSYGLTQNIHLMQRNNNLAYKGTTGTLRLEANGRIRRQLEWFQISKAQAVHLRLATSPEPPQLELSDKDQ